MAGTLTEKNTMGFERLELVSEHGCFGGVQRFYKHASSEIGLPMGFALFLPPQALAGQAVRLEVSAGCSGFLSDFLLQREDLQTYLIDIDTESFHFLNLGA